MKTIATIPRFIVLILLLATPGWIRAQGTAFTYQGHLLNGTNPASGTYNFEFSLFSAASGGSQVGSTVTNSGVGVTNGLFTTPVDFGSNVFTGATNWLQIGVETSGSNAFITLMPRQEMTPTPNAIYAENARNLSGTLSLAQLPGSVVTNNEASVTLTNLTLNGALSVSGIARLNDYNLYLRPGGDTYNGLGFFGMGSLNGLFAGVNVDGPVLWGNGGGELGTVSLVGTQTAALSWNSSGQVGIGTPTPETLLQVAGPAGTAIRVTGAGDGTTVSYDLSTYDPGTNLPTARILATDDNWSADLDIMTKIQGVPGTNALVSRLHISSTNGFVGIGTTNPTNQLDINGTMACTENFWCDHSVFCNALINLGPDLEVDGGDNELAYLGGFAVDDTEGLEYEVTMGSFNTNVTSIAFMNWNTRAWMHIGCSSITIWGGSDLAEPFPISAKDREIPQGSVVVIDEENPGQLKLSAQPYDTHVAGVVSGANGVNPGIQMQQQGLLEGGKNVALTGRVYVQADASNGAIKPGDLLTTSAMPGHAMKVTDHARAQGAILGKAMTGLKEGKGMVLVLVTLQ